MRIILEMAEYLESRGRLSLQDIRWMISKGLLASKYWNGIASWIEQESSGYFFDDYYEHESRQDEQERPFHEEACYWESVESALRKPDERRRAKKRRSTSKGARPLRQS